MSITHLLVLGVFTGGAFWLQDRPPLPESVPPPSHLCDAIPSDCLGTWHELSHGDMISFDPTLWHATDVIQSGCRYS
eukprot:4168035-Amphidinium_carterae.1